MCILLGTLSQIRISNIKLILIFSSITHISWIFLPRKNIIFFIIIYLIVYTLILFTIMLELKKDNLNYLWKILRKEKKTFIRIIILSIAGIPPLLGFIPKWISLNFIVKLNQRVFIITIIVILTTVNFYIYRRLITPLFLTKINKIKIFYKEEKKKSFIINLILPSIPLLYKK